MNNVIRTWWWSNSTFILPQSRNLMLFKAQQLVTTKIASNNPLPMICAMIATRHSNGQGCGLISSYWLTLDDRVMSSCSWCWCTQYGSVVDTYCKLQSQGLWRRGKTKPSTVVIRYGRKSLSSWLCRRQGFLLQYDSHVIHLGVLVMKVIGFIFHRTLELFSDGSLRGWISLSDLCPLQSSLSLVASSSPWWKIDNFLPFHPTVETI